MSGDDAKPSKGRWFAVSLGLGVVVAGMLGALLITSGWGSVLWTWFLDKIAIVQGWLTGYVALFPAPWMGYATFVAAAAAADVALLAGKLKRDRAAHRRTLGRILAYVRPHWGYAVVIVLAMLLAAALSLAQPWILGIFLINNVIVHGNLGQLPFVLLLLIVAFGGQQLASFVEDYFTDALSAKTLHKMRSDLYEHVQRLPMGYLDKARSGDLVSRLLSDTDEIQDVMTSELPSVAADFITVVGAVALLFVVGPNLALLVVPVMLGLVLVVNLFKKSIKRSSKRIREAVSELHSRAYESITGIRIIKSFNVEKKEADEFRRGSMRILRSQIRLARLSSLYSSTVDLLTTLALLAVLVIAVPSVVSGAMTLGALIAFMGYMDKLFSPLVALSKSNFKFQEASAAGDRLFEIEDVPQEALDEGRQPGFVRGHIQFDHVGFGYVPGKPVLEDFNLVIKPGETVAVVGHSGAGKSTVVSLLLRFYEPTAGRILIDGHPIEKFKLSFLRQNIGLVMQDPFLFSGTIRSNIASSNPDVPDEDIILAAKAANAHEFIMGLPKGYNTRIGERGVDLSVGQRQRIAIARALLKDPRILVLDEATSNVDSHSEVLIQEAMDNLVRGRTTIVIAHRLSTVKDADRIVVLVDGKIAEIGTHEDLLVKQGDYVKLYEAQLNPALALEDPRTGLVVHDSEEDPL